nr:uncharacterized protein LOC111511485 isoform X1 [Leptinotarsa decemlineata]
MEQLEGERANQKLYLDSDGYLYCMNKVKQKRYLLCRWRNRCPGRLIWKNDGHKRLSVEHNHVPDKMEVQIARFKTFLRQRARESTISIHQVFLDAEQLYPEAAIAVGGFTGVKNLMYRSRKPEAVSVPCNTIDFTLSVEDDKYLLFGSFVIMGKIKGRLGVAEGKRLFASEKRRSRRNVGKKSLMTRFPADVDERAVWFEKLGLKQCPENVSKYARICSVHFEEKDFEVKPSGKIFLKKGARPRFYVDEYVPPTSRLDNTTEESTTDTASENDCFEVIESFDSPSPLKR